MKPSSYDRFKNTIKIYIIPNLGFLQVKNVSTDDIQNLLNKLVTKGLSYSSIKKIYEAINACFKYAVEKDVLIKNPTTSVLLPSQKAFDNTEIIYFNEEELKRLKDEMFRTYSIGSHVYVYNYAYILILNTGLRIGEALALKWSDVDFKSKTLHVKRNVVMTKKRNENNVAEGGYNIKIQDTVKSKSSNRIIPINENALDALNHLKEKKGLTDFVIINSKHKQTLPTLFTRTFVNIQKNAKFKQTTGVHSLRHTFASMSFMKGYDVKIISELLGHSSVTITYNTYIHLINEQKQNALASLDNI